jgi:hypothetical protein
VFRGAGLWQLPFPGGEPIPYLYDTRELEGRALYVSSHGVHFKTDLSGGVGGYPGHYPPPPPPHPLPLARSTARR